MADNWNRRRHPVIGIALHWTAGDFRSSVDWCRDERSQVSYHAIVSRTGEVALIAPWDARAWAMGATQTSDPVRLPYPVNDANSVFESIAFAGGPPQRPTLAQLAAVIGLVRERFIARRWPLTDGWRITSHRLEAWPRGRKHDPDQVMSDGKPWLDLDVVRSRIQGAV